MDKYTAIYNSIVNNAKLRNWKSSRYSIGSVDSKCYTETHHIIPRCLGGDDSSDNLCVLTAKEHFICHYLLTKMYKGDKSILLAFSIMCNKTPGKSSNDYSEVRKNLPGILRESISNYFGEGESEARIKFRKDTTERWKDAEYAKKVKDGIKLAYKNTDYREKVRKSSLERMADPEQKRKWKESFTAYLKKYWTEENRVKTSNRIKLQNKNNKELLNKRLKAIEHHQKIKSDEWKSKMSILIKEHCSKDDVKKQRRDRMYGENSPVARKVYNLYTGELYFSAADASRKLGINVSTLKKSLYNGSSIDKYNCIWYDEYLTTNQGGLCE